MTYKEAVKEIVSSELMRKWYPDGGQELLILYNANKRSASDCAAIILNDIYDGINDCPHPSCMGCIEVLRVNGKCMLRQWTGNT